MSNKIKPKQEVFETNYYILRNMVISTILSCLGYSKSDVKYIRKKNKTPMIKNLEVIFECSPIFDEDGFYITNSNTFLNIFIAKTLISFYNSMDDIINVMMDKNLNSCKYPLDEVLKLFDIISEFSYSGLNYNGANHWTEDFLKLNKKMNLLEHNRVNGVTDLKFKIINGCYKYPNSLNPLIDIMKFGIMVCFNVYLPEKIENSIIECMRNGDIKKSMNILNDFINNIQSNMAQMYQDFLESHPVTYTVFYHYKDILDTALLIDYVKFIFNDIAISNYINKILYS